MGDATVRAVFFDIRDTLGVVDRPGHLVKFKPSTDQLFADMQMAVGLRIGLITNLPSNVTHAQGRSMIDEAGIGEFLDPKGFITNHNAGIDKPKPGIFAYAAKQLGLPPEQCMFVGENLVEVIAAQAAGMRAVLKPFGPGREFLFRPIKPLPPGEKFSGRLSEVLMEEDHLVGKRIVGCAIKIRDRLKAIREPVAGAPVPSLPMRAMSLLVWLTQQFIDAFHHRKEEEVLIPFALARGLKPEDCAFVAIEHDQGRAYFRGMDLALQRIRACDLNALGDFYYNACGFIDLYREHGRKEDDILLKKIGDLLTDTDDALIIDLMNRVGPADVTLYYETIAQMEHEVAS